MRDRSPHLGTHVRIVGHRSGERPRDGASFRLPYSPRRNATRRQIDHRSCAARAQMLDERIDDGLPEIFLENEASSIALDNARQSAKTDDPCSREISDM